MLVPLASSKIEFEFGPKKKTSFELLQKKKRNVKTKNKIYFKILNRLLRRQKIPPVALDLNCIVSISVS